MGASAGLLPGKSEEHIRRPKALEQRGGRYGLQTIREANGMANTTIIERL